MGNLTTCCRSRRNNKANILDLERDIYLKGSMRYLDLVGMNQDGSINPNQKRQRRPENLDVIFNEYCDEFLELENNKDYKYFNGTLSFGYFLKVYKAAFFWKKVRFENYRQDFLYKRRGFLNDDNMKMYKIVVD